VKADDDQNRQRPKAVDIGTISRQDQPSFKGSATDGRRGRNPLCRRRSRPFEGDELPDQVRPSRGLMTHTDDVASARAGGA
jgi:hypothetical protein